MNSIARGAKRTLRVKVLLLHLLGDALRDLELLGRVVEDSGAILCRRWL